MRETWPASPGHDKPIHVGNKLAIEYCCHQYALVNLITDFLSTMNIIILYLVFVSGNNTR